MGIHTLLRYLFGDRRAIEQIASTRGALWVGLAFVFSAALARDYDGEYLPARPWLLIVPAVASLLVAALLFLPFYLAQPHRPAEDATRGLRAAFRSFLTLFWMTAPLAWLYAIPYERFLSAVDATRANLWTLALVATWRVVLITRAIGVLTSAPASAVFVVVVLVADVVLQASLALVPLPIIEFMGGVRMSESDQFIASVSFSARVLGTLALPVLLIGAAFALGGVRRRIHWSSGTSTSHRVSRSVAALAVVSVLVWLPLLPVTQRAPRARHQVEQAMRRGDLNRAIALMSARQPQDFPPHWDPPPRLGYVGAQRALIAVLERLADGPAVAPWVRKTYADKFEYSYLSGGGLRWVFDEDDWRRIDRLLTRLPEADGWMRRYGDEIKSFREQNRAADVRRDVPTSRPLPATSSP